MALPSIAFFLPPSLHFSVFFFFLAPKSYTVHSCFYLFTMTYNGNCSYQFIQIFLVLFCGGRELEIWISLHFHQKWVGYWKHRWVLAFRDLLTVWQTARYNTLRLTNAGTFTLNLPIGQAWSKRKEWPSFAPCWEWNRSSSPTEAM